MLFDRLCLRLKLTNPRYNVVHAPYVYNSLDCVNTARMLEGDGGE